MTTSWLGRAMPTLYTVVAAVVGLIGTGSMSAAHAAPIVNSFGLASPENVVTFSELSFPGNTLITNQFSPFGITLSPGHHYNSQGPAPFPGITGDYVGVSQGVPFQIIFGETVSEAAFGYAKNPTTVLVEALMGATVVESFSQAVTYDNAATAFLGFSGIAFDRIQVTANVSEGLIDNIQFSAAPEPATLALLGVALAGLGFARRRKLR